jgi:hypothetical protein
MLRRSIFRVLGALMFVASLVGVNVAVSVFSAGTKAGASPTYTYSLHPGITCSNGNVLNVYAHQDDWIFMDPDIQMWISGGECVTSLQLTAGDAGNGSSYWISRNQGEEAAYGEMAYLGGKVATATPAWSQTSFSAVVSGVTRTISEYYITSYPEITILAMLLPDGSPSGTGYPSTGYTSLYKLAVGSISSISSLDTVYPNTWTEAQLLNFMTATYEAVAPARFNVQDLTLPDNSAGQFVGTLSNQTGLFGNVPVNDHSDHMWGGEDAIYAVTQSPWYGSNDWIMQAYMDYPSTAAASSGKYFGTDSGVQNWTSNQYAYYNVPPQAYPTYNAYKWAAWDAYAPYDSAISSICPSYATCLSNGDSSSLAAQYFNMLQGEWTRAEWNYGLGY